MSACPAHPRAHSFAPAAGALLLMLAAGIQAGHAQAAVAPPSHEGSGIDAAACAHAPGPDRAALERIGRALRAQGMALQARCRATPAHTAWVVQVRVVDGLKASKVVRGPLADGHEVDMGTPAGVAQAGAPVGAAGYSPDVQFNRAWLRTLMARQQFDNLPDAWWHFALRGHPPGGATAQGTLAAR